MSRAFGSGKVAPWSRRAISSSGSAAIASGVRAAAKRRRHTGMVVSSRVRADTSAATSCSKGEP